MNYLLVAQMLALLTLANGAPVVAKKLLGDTFSIPVDGHLKFFDGQPLLGSSKTLRGLLAAVGATALCAPLLGLDMAIGLVIGLFAMAGDLLSSFLKRRLKLASSSKVTGLDQIPESLIPLLVSSNALSLTWLEILAGTMLFSLGAVLLSPLLFRLKLREHPH